jgi:subtilisin family serine protease
MLKLRPHLLAALFVALLPGCGSVTQDPGNRDQLTMNTVWMLATDTATATVAAEGSWRLTHSSSWLTVAPSSGTGNTTVSIKVDASELVPGRYSGSFIVVDATDRESVTPVEFSFPRLTGTVQKALTSPTLSTAGVGQPLPSGPGRLLVGLPRNSALSPSAGAGEEFRDRARRLADEINGVELKEAHPRSGVAVFETSDRRSAAVALQRNPRVRYVEPDGILDTLVVNDPSRNLQWALDKIGADSAWSVNTGARAKIAVIDSGFHPGHPDLAGNLSYTYDFGDGRSSVASDNPKCGTHGTHVAGIAAAEGNNLTGIAGVAYDVSLLLLDVNTAGDADCPIYVSSMVSALEWVAGGTQGEPRADVVNISLGSSLSNKGMHDAVIAANGAGVTVVAAAGNVAGDPVMYPAAYAEVIAVSATGPTDEIAYYSSTGPEIWISAPGGDASLGTTSAIYSTVNDSGYEYMQGTSMASPAVAGVAALIRSVNADLGPTDVAEILKQSSKDLGVVGRDDVYGHGRLDAGAALNLALNWIPSTMTYLIRSSDGHQTVAALDGAFDLGYSAVGELKLEAFTDDDADGIPGGPGDYYGMLMHTVEFDGTDDEVTIVVEQVQ